MLEFTVIKHLEIVQLALLPLGTGSMEAVKKLVMAPDPEAGFKSAPALHLSSLLLIVLTHYSSQEIIC